MNITTKKLIANEVIREINLLQHTDWTAEQRQERIEVMQNALDIIETVLADICETDFNSGLYFSSQKGQVEHYLQICIDQLPLENTEDELFKNDSESHTEHDFESNVEGVERNSKNVVIGMILFWVLFLLAAFLS